MAKKVPDWAKRTSTEQARVNAAQANYAAYKSQMEINDKIANTPTETPGYGLYANPAPVSPYNAPAQTVPTGYAALANPPAVESAPKTVPTATATPTPATGVATSVTNMTDEQKRVFKQNNPAMYNQMLTQGIISPLPEDKKTATAPAAASETVTVPKYDEGSPSTGETEQTGYAKYLADHPEYAEADRRAEAEYARSLPTYGALAERMAQAGIHGGYGEYLDSVAYAQMQSAKEGIAKEAREGYAEYAGENGTGTSQVDAMYAVFGKGGYTDADGNTVQGYGLLEIDNDDDYANAKARARADAIYQGADEATVDKALARVDEMRDTIKRQAQTNISDKMTKYNEGKLGSADLIASIGYTPKEGESESSAFLSALDYAVENKLISPEQRSEALKNGLSLYGEKPGAKDVLKSVKTAIDLKDEGAMTEADKNAVLDDALEEVEKYFKSKKWTVKIENGKIYAKNKAGKWEDLGNLKYKSEFETVFKGSYYNDVVKLVYENRTKN